MSRFGNLEFDRERDDAAGRERLRGECDFLKEAEEAFRLGRFERALRAYAKALEFNAQNAIAWTGQVRMLIELEEFEEAKAWADKALELFGNDGSLLAAKAVALARLADTAAGLAFSDASMDYAPDNAYVWLSRGDVLMARREKRAEYCFEKALLFAPGDWVVRWLASRIHYFHGKFASALKLAQEALSLDATQAVIWLQIGRCQEALGIPTLAMTSYRHALELNPGCRDAESALAVAQQECGLFSRLRSAWKRLFLQ